MSNITVVIEADNLPDLKSLNALIRYDPDTGDMFWRTQTRTRKTHRPINQATNYYRVIVIGKRSYYAHRIAAKMITGQLVMCQVDHINGCEWDNRACNLRLVSHSQNLQNQRRHNPGLKGVRTYQLKNSTKYYATIRVNGKLLHLGVYLTPEQAHQAYCNAALEHFGEYAHSGVAPIGVTVH